MLLQTRNSVDADRPWCLVSINISQSHLRSLKFIQNNTYISTFNVCKGILVFRCKYISNFYHFRGIQRWINDLKFWVRGHSSSSRMRVIYHNWSATKQRPHSRSMTTVPFESFGMVSYSHSIATTAISLVISTHYTNVTSSQTDTTQRHRQHLCIASHGKTGSDEWQGMDHKTQTVEKKNHLTKKSS